MGSQPAPYFRKLEVDRIIFKMHRNDVVLWCLSCISSTTKLDLPCPVSCPLSVCGMSSDRIVYDIDWKM